MPSGSGLVLHWTRETPTAEQIRREAIAEAVRVMAVATLARPESVRSLLHREGLAYALGGNPYGPVTAEDQQAVGDAVDVLGASEVLGDMRYSYGDAAAATMGWTPLELRARRLPTGDRPRRLKRPAGSRCARSWRRESGRADASAQSHS